MNIRKRISEKNGSTLTMVLFLLFLLSVTAIAVITLTGSELGMSVMTSDRSKALMAAQSGAERAAQLLDEEVALLQEEARVKASEVIMDKIEKYSGDEIPVTSDFYEIIDTSTPGDFKVIDQNKFDEIYYREYKYWLNRKLDAWLALETSEGSEWHSNKLHYVKTIAPGPTEPVDQLSSEGIYKYSDVIKKPASGAPILTTLSSSDVQTQISSIAMTSTGQYKSTNGSTYSRKINVEFGILTDVKGDVTDVPISYANITRVRANPVNKPEILKNKALVARGNIISVNGTANINGDVLSFGYIPPSAGSDVVNNDDIYKSNLSGYDFGGIMAGLTSSVFSNADPDFYGVKLKENLSASKTALGIEDNFFTKNHSGSFEINGNAGTLAYTHILYSDYEKPSRIEVSGITESTGNLYSRSLKIENKAHSSHGQFKNVYLTDDLRIDASNARVSIGKWNDDTPGTEPGEEGTLVGLNTGGQYSSSAAVLGDSELYINGSIYMGGSTYFNEYTKNTMGLNEMYPSGISVLKSGSEPARAFEFDEVFLPEPDAESFPGNVFFLYDNTRSDYINVNDPHEENKLETEQYKKIVGISETGGITNEDVKMMQGSTGGRNSADPTTIINRYLPFRIDQRAMHFKKIWENFWKDDIGYNTYLNTGDIKITTDGGKIKGWSYGAVAANNTIYGPYNGFTESSPVNYGLLVSDTVNPMYAKFMNLFLKNFSNNGEIIKSLCVAKPQKELAGNVSNADDSIDKTAVIQDQLIKSNNIIMLNSSENVVIGRYLDTYSIRTSKLEQSFTKNELESEDGQLFLRGVIYSDKDIYVKAGTIFKGILIAQGNIVFLGNSTVNYDEDIIDSLIDDEPKVGRFFRFSPKDIIINDRSTIATIKKSNVKNIKILSWKEL